MAFLQPHYRPQAPRQTSFSQPEPTEAAAAQLTQQRKRTLEESQEWILFSPVSGCASQTTTSQTPRTANFSRVSDFGSVETRARSNQVHSRDEDLTCQGTEIDGDENEDLDSLDDGLHAFQAPLSPHLDQSGGTVLPKHDGLGTFRTGYAQAANDGAQEQLWQYERYNPQRRRSVHRRRSSVQKRLDAVENEEEIIDPHEERRLRVEKWRLEQSKAVSEEIERETRRRHRRASRVSGITSAIQESTVKPPRTQNPSGLERSNPVSQDEASQPDDSEESETFWQRITRKFIRDLIGLDEKTLSVILGEELQDDLATTPTPKTLLMEEISDSTVGTYPDRPWERRLLERIARELGILVHQLSEVEGAFSTYATQQPSSTTVREAPSDSTPKPATATTSPTNNLANNLTSSDALFAPTLPQNNISHTSAADASLWGIEEEPSASRPIPSSSNKQTKTAEPESDYWERDLDVRMIFTYLRTRFLSRPSSPSPQPAPTSATNAAAASGPLPATWAQDSTASALGTSPESLRRADLIRRHHPLVSRAAERRRESLLRRHHSTMLHRRRTASSSCASQSTKRSRTSTGASRKYWDFPGGAAGGAGGGSCSASSLASAGVREGGGGWGEV